VAAQGRRRRRPARRATGAALADETVDLAAFEADKIKGAIRTDFVLSAEIVVIALGTVADQPFTTQVAVLSGIGLLMTVGVYGVVAGIVKMDDLGLHLLTRSNALRERSAEACCWRRRA
jgi:predicted DNA repair protein MutK